MKTKRITALLTGIMIICSFTGAGAVDYTAQKGDSYYTVAQKYGINFFTLLSANNATQTSYLKVGDTVKIPLKTDSVIAKKGDTYWQIAKNYGVDFDELLKLNGANKNSYLEIGDLVLLPSSSSPSSKTASYTVKNGDTYWYIAKKQGIDFWTLLSLNGADDSSQLSVGQVIKLPGAASSGGSSGSAGSSSGGKASVTYTTYKVKNSDTLWSIAQNCGIPLEELLEANGLKESSYIYAGQTLTVPVHHVPVKDAPKGCGELLDWWSEAQYVLPVGAVFTVVDFYTGVSFTAKRTTGAYHADCEPMTKSDTAALKKIWGGTFNWNKRPVLIVYNGRTLAASAAGMLHAGNDAAEGGVWTSWRSDNYGAGYNFDWVKGNDADGHFDIHFLNSLKHNSGSVDSGHQKNIKIAAGA